MKGKLQKIIAVFSVRWDILGAFFSKLQGCEDPQKHHSFLLCGSWHLIVCHFCDNYMIYTLEWVLLSFTRCYLLSQWLVPEGFNAMNNGISSHVKSIQFHVPTFSHHQTSQCFGACVPILEGGKWQEYLILQYYGVQWIVTWVKIHMLSQLQRK